MYLQPGRGRGLYLTKSPKRLNALIALAWALAFVAGLGAGRWLGAEATAAVAAISPPQGMSSPSPVAGLSPSSSPDTPQSTDGTGASVASSAGAPIEAASSLADYPGDTSEVLGAAIDTLRDDEIIAALSTITDAHPEDLRDVSDPRALAQRMSAIAMEDLIRAPSERPGGLARVYFSEEELKGDPDREGAGTGREFSGQEPILATFSNADYREDRVFLKWSRVDDPSIVLFRPYPVDRGPRYSAVWLEPRNELPPGRYRVAVYSSDEALDPVASGLYSVVASPND